MFAEVCGESAQAFPDGKSRKKKAKKKKKKKRKKKKKTRRRRKHHNLESSVYLCVCRVFAVRDYAIIVQTIIMQTFSTSHLS